LDAGGGLLKSVASSVARDAGGDAGTR